MGAERMRTRAIPRTGEQVPAIGMGTWRTFDTAERTALVDVVRTLLDAGGAVIDSSPMYGRSETTVGEVLTCPIPATSNPAHMADDVRAGFGRLPDEAMRRRIVKEVLG